MKKRTFPGVLEVRTLLVLNIALSKDDLPTLG
jgi:hypothetical protein